MRPVLGEEQNPSNPTFVVIAVLFPVKYSHFLQDTLGRKRVNYTRAYLCLRALLQGPHCFLPWPSCFSSRRLVYNNHLPYTRGLSKSPLGNLLAPILFSSLVSPNCWAKALAAPRENTQHFPSS